MKTQPITTGWLVYRIMNGQLEVVGLCQTEEAARASVKAIPHMEFSLKQVMFMGWGQVEPGVFSRNDKKGDA
jgi:hypothetical protein